MLEEAVTIVVQDYGPIGVATFLLWRRQNRILDALDEYDPITVDSGMRFDGGQPGGGD